MASSPSNVALKAASDGNLRILKRSGGALHVLLVEVTEIDPLDATMFANRSLCWLRMREGDRALEDARQCRMMQPSWSKAWYREGKALSFMKDYKGAADAFLKAQKLDPKSDEVTEALRKAIKAMEELRM